MNFDSKHALLAMILVGMSLIPIGDSAGKLLTEAGVSPAFISWSRLLVGLLFILPFSGLKSSELKSLYNWRLLCRAVPFTGAIFFMISALKTEPIANVFGIFFIGPIVAYFLAALVLKERITWLRSIILFIGFGGVLLVVKPGIGISSGMLFAFIAGIFYGCMLVTNRWLSHYFRPRLIHLSTLLAGSIVFTPIVIGEIPETIDGHIAGLILISSLASAIGNLIIIEVSRRLDANIIAPLVYSQLITAAILSVFLFDDWPDIYSLLGLFIIFTSGVLSYLFANRKTHIKIKETT